MKFQQKNGLNVVFADPPAQRIAGERQATLAALVGRDYPGVKFSLLVPEGRRVQAGDALMCDSKRPEIVFPSPVTGTVTNIHRGQRRAIVSVQIAIDPDANDSEGSARFEITTTPARDEVRKLMLASGLWASLKTRPFGHIPQPDSDPKALFVTAIDTEPLAPDPRIVIDHYVREFAYGIDLLSVMCNAPVFLCRSPGSGIAGEDGQRVHGVEFEGPHPAGLPGTHIHAVSPIGFNGTEAWHIGYQDVISLGMLFTTGMPWWQRVISVAGNGVSDPRLLKVTLGGRIEDLVGGALGRLVSGSALSGFIANGAQAFLGRFHNQISVLPQAEQTNPGPLIPFDDLDRVAPPGMLAVPFMRALLVGDVDRARDLGALEWVEEDMSLLSYVCATNADYGALLRDVLRQLQ